jgi:histone methylation protein DOT1
VVDVSTIHSVLPLNEIDRLSELRHFLRVVGDANHLLLPEHLTMRLSLLDKLDALTGDLDSCCGSGLIMAANAISSEFEAANEKLYEAAHAEIALRGNSPALDRWLRELVNDGEAERPHPGLSFDLLDEIVSGVLHFRGPGEAGPPPSPEMTAYQPTPARHILDLIAGCRFSTGDVFVDLGSGLGHVPLLVCLLAGIRARGVEVQPDHAASAQETARCLNLSRVQFLAEDARMTDLSDGTVFYLFTPFTGSILADVVDRLHTQSKTRQIKICTLGPCTCILQGQTWLTVDQRPDTERIAIFRSR